MSDLSLGLTTVRCPTLTPAHVLPCACISQGCRLRRGLGGRRRGLQLAGRRLGLLSRLVAASCSSSPTIAFPTPPAAPSTPCAHGSVAPPARQSVSLRPHVLSNLFAHSLTPAPFLHFSRLIRRAPALPPTALRYRRSYHDPRLSALSKPVTRPRAFALRLIGARSRSGDAARESVSARARGLRRPEPCASESSLREICILGRAGGRRTDPLAGWGGLGVVGADASSFASGSPSAWAERPTPSLLSPGYTPLPPSLLPLHDPPPSPTGHPSRRSDTPSSLLVSPSALARPPPPPPAMPPPARSPIPSSSSLAHHHHHHLQQQQQHAHLHAHDHDDDGHAGAAKGEVLKGLLDVWWSDDEVRFCLLPPACSALLRSGAFSRGGAARSGWARQLAAGRGRWMSSPVGRHGPRARAEMPGG